MPKTIQAIAGIVLILDTIYKGLTIFHIYSFSLSKSTKTPEEALSQNKGVFASIWYTTATAIIQGMRTVPTIT